jgi:hypothetical protein
LFIFTFLFENILFSYIQLASEINERKNSIGKEDEEGREWEREDRKNNNWLKFISVVSIVCVCVSVLISHQLIIKETQTDN